VSAPASLGGEHFVETLNIRSLLTMPQWNALGEPDAAESARTSALYIASMTEELGQLAKRHGLDALGYILDMARLEAEQIAKTSSPIKSCA
jgi:hypothetical protein